MVNMESPVHSKPISPVMGNVDAGAGWKDRKLVKRKLSIDVYFTAPLVRDAVMEPRQQHRKAEDGGAGSPSRRIHS